MKIRRLFILLTGIIALRCSAAETEQNTLEKFNNWVFTNANSYVMRTDKLFASENQQPMASNSTFSAELYFEIKNDSDFEMSVSPSFSADLQLPNLEQRLHVFVDNINKNELAGTDPINRDSQLHIGASRMFDFFSIIDLNLSAGIKWRWPPVLFGDVEWEEMYGTEDRSITPAASVFWYSDDGFGTKGSLVADNWLNERFLLRSETGGRWTETTDGFEWSQSLASGYILEGSRKDGVRRLIGNRLSAFGHKSGVGVVDLYRIEAIYRQPLYKNLLFFSITPKIEWERDNDFNTVPSIMFGVDIYFRELITPNSY